MDDKPIVKRRASKYDTNKLYHLTPFEAKTIEDIKIYIEIELAKLQIDKKEFAKAMGITTSRLSNLMKYRFKGEVWKIFDICKLVQQLKVSIVFNSDGVTFIPHEYFEYSRQAVINKNKIKKPKANKIKVDVIRISDYNPFKKWYSENCLVCKTTRNCPGKYAADKMYYTGVMTKYHASFIGIENEKLAPICKQKDKQINALPYSKQMEILNNQ